ncbi:MAG TPA: hypothetical protein VIX89_20620, partial [Bryobacteraceae bacterium]
MPNSKKVQDFLTQHSIRWEREGDYIVVKDIRLSGNHLDSLPDLSAVIVRGDFDCSENRLTSLKGVPQRIGGSFLCWGNRLASLDGGPQEIGGDFNCSTTELYSNAVLSNS